MRLALFTGRMGAAAACWLFHFVPGHAQDCAPRDPAPVVRTMRAMYATMVAADERPFLGLFTPDAYLFDGGKRFTPPQIRAAILKMAGAGKRFTWSVVSPDVHIECRTARIALVNQGSVTVGRDTTPRTWLESADLVWNGSAWQLAFFHSTPAASAS